MNTASLVRRRINARLKREKRTKNWLASELGISRSYLYMLLAGQRRMSLDIALRLNELTGVPVRDLAKVA